MMPLALLGVGESGTITDIRGKEEVVHHLHNLGFAAGTDVEVVGNTDAGMIFFSSRRMQAAISVKALPMPNSVDFLPSMIVIPICLVASKTFSLEIS